MKDSCLFRQQRNTLFAALAAALMAAGACGQSLPANFSDALVVAVSAPTATAFTPDGRLLIASQGGSLRVFKSGALVATPALSFNPAASGLSPKICQGGEQGLLGVAVDPQFTANRYVYLYYTARNGSDCSSANYTAANAPGTLEATPEGTYSAFNRKANRVSRFVLGTNANADLVDPATEVVLVDRMPARGSNHNAGDVHFGKDGLLYISIGDGGTNYNGTSPGSAGGNDASRDKHVLTGKILRVTRDGGVPPGNPFFANGARRCNVTGATTIGEHCEETFAWGLRNPFRFAMDPNASATRFYINDVGQGLYEEVNEGQAGADYGWNCREGRHDNNTGGPCSPRPVGMVDPVYEYPRSTIPGTSVAGCASITGGAFVPDGVWPAAYDGTYLLADYVCGAMLRIPTTGTPTAALTNAFAFVTGLGGSSATSMQFGPDVAGSGMALYYTTYAAGGQIRKITYSSTGAPTVSALSALPSAGTLPLDVTFTATASDPNGDELTYFWNFGDGTSATTATANITKRYAAAGVFNATVSVRDSLGNTSASAASATVRPGNAPPSVSITAPGTGYLFSVGDSITLSAVASDPEDGMLAAGALSWQVLLHHDSHAHPLLAATVGNNITFSAPAPEDLAAAVTSYLEVLVTATDSGGATTVTSQSIMPRKVALTFAAAPQPAASAARLTINGNTQLAAGTAGNVVTAWAGWALPVTVRDQNRGANGLRFGTWSDGGARTHSYIVPGSDATLTATLATGPFVPSIDIDNDGNFDAATDGVLLLRYLFGMRDATLTNAALGVNAERNAAAISSYIAALGNGLDIDGDNSVKATTDGLLVLRYLLGLRGTALTSGAVIPSTVAPADVERKLLTLLP